MEYSEARTEPMEAFNYSAGNLSLGHGIWLKNVHNMHAKDDGDREAISYKPLKISSSLPQEPKNWNCIRCGKYYFIYDVSSRDMSSFRT